MRKFILSAAVLLFALPALPAQSQESDFLWDSHIINRAGRRDTTINGTLVTFRVDSNRSDLYVPLFIGGTNPFTIRGMGQVLSPRWSYPIFENEYVGNTSESTNYLSELESRDSDYINQFKGVQSWQLTAMRMALYQNFQQSSSSIAQISLFRLNTDYSVARNRDSMLTWSRTDLEANRVGDPFIMVGEDLDATVDQERQTIEGVVLEFDPPLEFGKNESVMAMFINDIADTTTRLEDDEDWQAMIGYLEYRGGSNTTTDIYRNPVPQAMVQGVYMRRPVTGAQDGSNDAAVKTYSLQINNIPYRVNFSVQWQGVVELDPNDVPKFSSIKYYLGEDATEQGLQDITPNPARDEATIPFTLTETSDITLDLYTIDGKKVETLMTKRYVPGKYSARYDCSDLQSGTYIVRMTANQKVYSTKLTIAK